MIVYYFSGAGHSAALARWLGERLDAPVKTMEEAPEPKADTAVIVFPVYCQKLPPPVRSWLKGLFAARVALFAVYGGYGIGNVLYDAARLAGGQVIAAAGVPEGHSFLGEPARAEYSPLEPVVARVLHPKQTIVERLRRNPLAHFFPAWRSRLGLSIRRTDACRRCGKCERACPMQAKIGKKPSRRCIRCMRCVVGCPQSALKFSLRPLTRRYLKKKRKNKWYVF